MKGRIVMVVLSVICRYGAIHQTAAEQAAVVSGNGDDMIVPLDADIFSGEYVGHIKAVSGGIGKSHIRKNAVHGLLLFVKVVVSNREFLIGKVFDEGEQFVFNHAQWLYGIIRIFFRNHDASFSYQVRRPAFRVLIDGNQFFI